MAGKRPDQYNIAPGEAGSTDYKRYPQTTHGQVQDQSTEGDKQRLAQQRQAAEEGGQKPQLPFPPDVPAPSADANRGWKEGAADSDSGKGNPLA